MGPMIMVFIPIQIHIKHLAQVLVHIVKLKTESAEIIKQGSFKDVQIGMFDTLLMVQVVRQTIFQFLLNSMECHILLAKIVFPLALQIQRYFAGNLRG